MSNLTEGKKNYLDKLTDDNGIINALAIDQRGSLKRMLGEADTENIDEVLSTFKYHISKKLTPYTSSILLDPKYGWKGANERDKNAGLIMAYEKTGYDATQPGRFPDLLEKWSVRKLKEEGADAIKFLLYYDVSEPDSINDRKKRFVERIGSECKSEDIPFFFEIVTYDQTIEDKKGKEYAKIKPGKVIEAMREFSDERYGVDVLKVEVPVNMNYVEGFSDGEVLHTKEDAMEWFKRQNEVTDIPFIFLSAGVSSELFQKTLSFAGEAGSNYNGILCGRATWKESVDVFVNEGEEAAAKWLSTQGKKNIEELSEILAKTARPIE
ncbi:tagatose-bisphosphate aldolase [Clostridium sp. D2Q-11]|uniref:Tagatose 1,6-diphosphate aldolase n=1 Tax=Anaeromonas frigoriresistens TaxID=2683708 RepID=A0A942Z828_9FIRM|nr:tagatose-bisphosphate aldolase [Anaeromonas frigoriresistens]MBS4537863.1 tagatose-bisphosphate aldolase [Anaeromonas frigoriresistens]